MKNLLKMSDLSPAELTHILDVADQLKADCKAGRTAPLLAGKSVALLFSKASTRTRTSFEVGVYQMGGLGNYMNTAELQAGRGEPLRDTARVLGRYYDCAVWRTYRQRDLEELAELSGIPVINGLTDYAHPCQVLADLMTIRERRGTLAGLKLCFVGDGSNMANSLIVGGLLAGMQVSCVCPPGYRPAADVLMFAQKYGNAFHLTTDPAEGLRDADIVATAAWNTTAPGTAESEQRLRDFVGFQLTGRLLENAKPGALVLHCLPAHRGEEISTAVFEAHADEIFTEAENRLHVQKAVLAVLLLRSLGVFGTPTTAQTTPTPAVPVETAVPTETPTPTPTPKPEPTYEVVTADVSWADAEAAAEAKGGHLVVIDSAEKWTRVAQLADESGLTYVWIGLHRTDSGELAWVKDNVDPVYNWASGEPSVHDTNGAAEDYVLITRTNSGWYYNDCIGDPAGRYPQFYSGKIGYIIEIDP